MLNGNIFFLPGCPCAGKTTVGRILAEKYGMLYFSGDGKRFDYYKRAVPEKHRYMTMDASGFWDWSLNEMIAWEKGVITEQTPMILEDLEELSRQYRYVLFEGMIDMDLLTGDADRSRIAYLTVDRDECERDFFARGDHQGMVDAILSTPGITEEEKGRRVEMRKAAALGAFYEDAARYGIKCFVRNDEESPEERAERIAAYFSLSNDIG